MTSSLRTPPETAGPIWSSTPSSGATSQRAFDIRRKLRSESRELMLRTGTLRRKA